MWATDVLHPDWVRGWAVVKGDPPEWEFAGIYETRAEAEAATVEAGEDFHAHSGAYNRERGQFISGPILEPTS